ncbi:MAG TPA: FtsX-like permease family protein [Solirubrobacteraceae bacterium]|nr:FtsX-like permease family protein [Solirubrobacteraceae bacterium]
MKLSSVVRLYRVRLRARAVQELFAVIGISIGLALLFASQVSSTSLDGSVEQLTDGLLGQVRFQLAARGAHGFDERLLRQVQLIPGVNAAIPVLETSANVIGSAGARSVELIATEPRFARLDGALVHNFGVVKLAQAKALMLPASIARSLGRSSLQRVEVQVGGHVAPALLVPELPGEVPASLASGPIAIAPLAYAQTLSGMKGRLSSIFVRSSPARDREVLQGLERVAAGRLDVHPAAFDGTLFMRAAGPIDQSTGLFSAISALVGFLFAFNALLLTVPQRRHLIDDLRLDGYTRKMIVEVLLLDALVLGVVSSIVGLVFGDLLSLALFDANPGYLSFAFPLGARRIIDASSVALCVGGGMIAACVGVLAPLRGALFSTRESFFRPARKSRVHGNYWLLAGAMLCLAITTLILVLAPASAIVGVLSLTAALLLLLPVLIDAVVFGFGRLQGRVAGASPYLAVIELRARAHRARSLAVAATGAIAVFGSVAIETAHGDLLEGLNRVASGLNATTGLWVSPAGSANSLATTPFDGSAVQGKLAGVPGVQAVRAYRGSFLDVGDRRAWVIAPPREVAQPLPRDQLVQGSLALAVSRFHAGGWVILSRAIAEAQHVRVGDSFLLPSPRPTVLRVAALSTNFGWPPGAIVLNADDYARAWGSADPSALEVDLRPGVQPALAAREARSTFGPHSALRVQTALAREQEFRATARQGLSRLTQISVLVLIAAVLAMAAMMGAMIWQRRPRLADMKVDGFDRGVLWRALLWESALLLGSGCSLGAVFGLLGQALLSRALVTVTGFPVAFSPGVPIALAGFAVVSATALLIIAIPGGFATRVRPALSLRD